jgi:hypothetical protein
MFALFSLALVLGCGDNEPGPSARTTGPAARAAAPVGLSTSAAGLRAVQTPTGVAVHLDDRFQHAAIARRAADGTLTTECHDDEQHAQAALAAAPARALEVQ